MFKIKRIFFIVHAIPKALRRLLTLLLCIITLLRIPNDANNSANAQSCSNLKFPITLGFSSGETEIISIDQDSSTGFLYIAGTTTTTELKVPGATKSVFIALFNGYDYVFIKAINDPFVDTVEYMSAMGNSSENLVLYATK